MNYQISALAALLLVSTAIAADDKPKEVNAQVERIDLTKKMLVYRNLVIGRDKDQIVGQSEIAYAKDCPVTINGRIGAFASLRTGDRLKLVVHPRTGNAYSIDATTPDVIRKQREVVRKEVDRRRIDLAAKIHLYEEAINARLIAQQRKERLEMQERARQRLAERTAILQMAYEQRLRGQPSGMATPEENAALFAPKPSRLDPKQDGMVLILTGIAAHFVAINTSTGISELDNAKDRLGRAARDRFLEEGFTKVLEGARPAAIRALVRGLGMVLDGTMSSKEYLYESSKEESILAVAKLVETDSPELAKTIRTLAPAIGAAIDIARSQQTE
jgi:hypothetical protein